MSDTPETDAICKNMNTGNYQSSLWFVAERMRDHAKQMERERDEWRITASSLKAGESELLKENAQLRDIVERAIKLIPPEAYGEHSYAKGILRAELDEIKEGAK